ncbi:cGMP-dependent protein kinase [Aureococcus anophagefferens]|nr:cGMP-dependent protein kinase [Aureococcus anophagefferens]
MGGGASVPAEMKQKIHSAFEIHTGDEWSSCANMSEQELRDEIKRLRQARARRLAQPLVWSIRRHLPPQLALTCVNAKHDHKRICGDSINFGNYTKKVVAKTDAVKKLIRQAMTSNSLFKRCRARSAGSLGATAPRKTARAPAPPQAPEKEELLDSFEAVKYGKGTTIIKQGDRGDDFFVMEMGTVEFYIEGNKKAVGACGSGKGFGELALMYNTPRAATVLAKTDIIAWKIDRERFRLVLANHAKARSEQYKALLMEIELNKKKAPETADGNSRSSRTAWTKEDVDDGVDIIKEGEDGHTFYIIANGEVEVSTAKAGKVASLKKGDYFGDRALVSDEKRAATCTAKGSATKVLAVDREDFCYSAAAGAELGAMLDALAGREAEVIMEELPPLLDASEVVAERLDAADAGSSTEDDEPCEPIMGWCHTCAASVRTRVDEETCEVECMRCSGTFVEQILSQVLAGGQASGGGEANVQVLGAMRPLFATTIGAGGGGIALGDYAVGNLSNVIEQLVNADQARPKPASKRALARLCAVVDCGDAEIAAGWECAIHKEAFVPGDRAMRLPCGHVFGEEAINTWLSEQRTCPVCRAELPTDEEEAARDAADAPRDAYAEPAAAAAAAANAATRRRPRRCATAPAPASAPPRGAAPPPAPAPRDVPGSTGTSLAAPAPARGCRPCGTRRTPRRTRLSRRRPAAGGARVTA